MRLFFTQIFPEWKCFWWRCQIIIDPPAIVMHIPYWPGYPRHSPRQNINRWRQTFPDMRGGGGITNNAWQRDAWRDETCVTQNKIKVHLSGQLSTFFGVVVWDSLALFTHLQPVIDLFISRNVIHSHQAVIKKFGQFSQRPHLNF